MYFLVQWMKILVPFTRLSLIGLFISPKATILAKSDHFTNIFEAKPGYSQPILRPEEGKPVSSSPDFLETSPQVRGKTYFPKLSKSNQHCSSVIFPLRSVDIHEDLRSPASLWTHSICVRNSQWRQRPDTPLLAPKYSFHSKASAGCIFGNWMMYVKMVIELNRDDMIGD